MKIEDLKEVNYIKQRIDRINTFIAMYQNKPKELTIQGGYFSILINEGQEYEIINALEKIKSNLAEQLKELGVEVDC